MKFNGIPDACGEYTYGQVEDYRINIQSSLSATELSKKNTHIYPNPTSGLIHIESVKKISSVDAYDISGTKVVCSQTQEVNLTEAPKGVYLLIIRYKDGSQDSRKVIKN